MDRVRPPGAGTASQGRVPVARLLSWIILTPLAVVIVVFAVSNRGFVVVELWPLPFTWGLPLFLVVLAGALAGFVLGAALAWIGGGKTRRRARAKARELESTLRDVAYLRQRVATLESAAQPSRSALPPPADAA